MRPRLISILAVLVAFGSLGYLVLDRMGRLEARLGEVGVQVSAIGTEARTAADAAARASERSEDALLRAGTAEESAREAALGREEAERIAARAEVTASLANDEAREARAELERIEAERQAEIDRLEEALGGVVETRRTAVGLVMSLGSDAVEFAFDEATLRGAERELLSRIAGVLLTARGFSVFVYGHTDDVGTDAYNQILSERRANAVRDYLVEAGIGPAIIDARGYGKSSPRIQGTTPEARSQNRRVEIGIVDVVLSSGVDREP
jgi:outer membrane protein OmpA-like peptidoglycan-associated protein